MRRRALLQRGAIATAAAGAGALRSASAAEPRQVRALSLPSDAAKQILYAQRSGIFLKHGLHVDVSSMGNGAATFAALVGGAADFGSGSLFPLFNAFRHGVPLRLVAPIGVYDTQHCDTWLLVAKGSPIHTPRDLDGKLIGADNATDVYVSATRAWLDRNGGDGGSLRSVEVSIGEQINALAAGRIDAAVVKPPFLTVATGSGQARPLGKPMDVIGPYFLASGWVASVDFIARNPDVVKAFAASLAESSRYTNAHPAETVEMVAAFSGQDPGLIARGVRTFTADTITLPMVQRPLDFAFASGFIDRHIDARALLASSVPLSHA